MSDAKELLSTMPDADEAYSVPPLDVGAFIAGWDGMVRRWEELDAASASLSEEESNQLVAGWFKALRESRERRSY